MILLYFFDPPKGMIPTGLQAPICLRKELGSLSQIPPQAGVDEICLGSGTRALLGSLYRLIHQSESVITGICIVR
jgi:hypothetical protein